MSEQLEINFNPQDNALRKALASGSFFFIVEANPPASQGTGAADALHFLESLAAEAGRHADLTTVALTDRLLNPDAMPPHQIAAKVRSLSGKAPLLHLSGKEMDADAASSILAAALSAGATSVLATTGDYHPSCRRYMESTRLLQLCARNQPGILRGATVNPFKYTVNAAYAQYYKLIQKIHAGAEFIITQAGPDMKKYDEVLRYVTHRELHIPLIARIQLIGDQHLEILSQGQIAPGVPVTREFAAQIQREAASSTQFMATQIRRLCLQIAGLSLMGYSAVQVAGLRNGTELAQFMPKARAALKEFPDIASWQRAWLAFHDGIPLANASHYYLYRHTEVSRPVDDIGPLKHTVSCPADFSYPSPAEIRRNTWARRLHLENGDGFFARFLRRRLTGSESRVQLREHQYMCLDSCPKGIVLGACGGVRTEDRCEASESTCIHMKRLGMAARFNELDTLEDAQG